MTPWPGAPRSNSLDRIAALHPQGTGAGVPSQPSGCAPQLTGQLGGGWWRCSGFQPCASCDRLASASPGRLLFPYPAACPCLTALPVLSSCRCSAVGALAKPPCCTTHVPYVIRAGPQRDLHLCYCMLSFCFHFALIHLVLQTICWHLVHLPLMPLVQVVRGCGCPNRQGREGEPNR